MSFGLNELTTVIKQELGKRKVPLYEYSILFEERDIEKVDNIWPQGQLEDGEGRLTEEDEEELDEISSVGGGAVEGTPGAFGKAKIYDPFKLREIVRSKILELLKEEYESYSLNEEKLRKVLRSYIKEAKANFTSNPHHLTGINVLEELLRDIIPTFEADYKTLTTSTEQREGYFAQLMHSIDNILNQTLFNKDVGADGKLDGQLEEAPEGSVNASKNNFQPRMVVTKENPFIDIYGEQDEEPEVDSGSENPTADPRINATGRAKAEETIKKISKQIIAAASRLSDPADVEAFSEFLPKNLTLYRDKFEDEVSTSLSQLAPEPDADDVVDTEDGLGPGELEPQGQPEKEDPFMPDDLAEEWNEAMNTIVEFY